MRYLFIQSTFMCCVLIQLKKNCLVPKNIYGWHKFETNDSREGKKMEWCLEAVADSDKVWQVTIESVPFVIGRGDDCNLKLIDHRISRHHSEIHLSGDILWIRDLESTNGTFVNQNKLDQAQLLEANDTISIGKYKFKVKTIWLLAVSCG